VAGFLLDRAQSLAQDVPPFLGLVDQPLRLILRGQRATVQNRRFGNDRIQQPRGLASQRCQFQLQSPKAMPHANETLLGSVNVSGYGMSTERLAQTCDKRLPAKRLRKKVEDSRIECLCERDIRDARL
jgi:hypothetical protein